MGNGRHPAKHSNYGFQTGRGLGAFAVYGSIADKWHELGGAAGYGYPITDVLPADRGGQFSDFDRANSIYWHPAHGAHAVYGFIRSKWRSLGAEHSFLGYPVTDEQPAANLGRFSAFAGGLIYWKSDFGAHAIYGEIGKKWLELGAERSPCGYPISDEEEFDDGRDGTVYGYGTGKRFRRSEFMHGQIVWSKDRNQVYMECSQQPSPPVGGAQPIISAGVTFESSGFHVLRVGGSGFNALEAVSLEVKYKAPGLPIFGVISNAPLTADQTGHISYHESVVCPATPPEAAWQLHAVGRSSGKSSIIVATSC